MYDGAGCDCVCVVYLFIYLRARSPMYTHTNINILVIRVDRFFLGGGLFLSPDVFDLIPDSVTRTFSEYTFIY